MFAFFRKYQRYFFLVISVVIIVSFSFFGTYNALPNEDLRSQTAFYASDGSAITRSDLDEMILFLSTDMEDKIDFGGSWGPNFLNDGVIRKDFLETGLAQLLAEQFPIELESDLEAKQLQEKKYEPYTNTENSFISTEAIWGYAAPEMKRSFDLLRSSSSPVDSAAFNARVNLYLGQKKLPPHMLKKFLKYQEQQYGWMKSDPNLERSDFWLFGYHTLNDWFGQRFIALAAEFIINSAKEAKRQGYHVSAEEAIAELNHQAKISFDLLAQSSQIGVTNSQEYLDEQLRLMQFDQRMAVKTWQNILLFRRLFQEAGNSIFVDPATFIPFIAYAKEGARGDLYQLPKALKLGDYSALQKFEVYLAAVGQTGNAGNRLALPTKFNSPAETKKKFPELVQKRYLIEISEVDKANLQAKVGLKETIAWQTDPQNWDKLKKEFPSLALKSSETTDERLKALDSLDKQARSKADLKARAEIVKTHPEWISSALDDAPSKTVEISLAPGSSSYDFKGISNYVDLMNTLDQSAINSSDGTATTSTPLAKYSGDQSHYYKIKLLAQAPAEEVMTFAEANNRGVLDKLVNQQLKIYYENIRGGKASQFQQADKSWKPFEEIKEQVADLYFATLLQAIKSENKAEKLTGDKAASLRLLSAVKTIREALIAEPERIEEFVLARPNKGDSDQLASRPSLEEQWKLEKEPFHIIRSTPDNRIDLDKALAGEEWSQITHTPTGGIYFYRTVTIEPARDEPSITAQVAHAHDQLSDEAQTNMAKRLVEAWKAKGALSLDYMQRTSETTAID